MINQPNKVAVYKKIFKYFLIVLANHLTIEEFNELERLEYLKSN